MDADMYGGVDTGFNAKQATDICRITHRQLDLWESAGLVRPSLEGPPGLRRRRYSYKDVLALEIIRVLLEWGAPLEQVQQAFDRIRTGLDQHPRETCMTVLDGDLIVFATPVEARYFVECDPDRGVYLVDIAEIKEDLDSEIRDVCPDYFEPEPWQDACFRYEMEAQAKRLREFLDVVQADDFDF